MSEEILRALTQLFAIITKQDGGVSENERAFVIRFFQTELDQDSIREYVELYDGYSGYNKPESDKQQAKLTSVKDSVKTLGICRKINKTLTQKQKVVVLIKLFELVGSDGKFTEQRMEIINTASNVFNISEQEYSDIVSFIAAGEETIADLPRILVVSEALRPPGAHLKHVHSHLHGNIIFLSIQGVDLYFVKYTGDESMLLNNFIMQPGRVYLFSHGSTIKLQQGDALYYSDLVANFNEELRTTRLSFHARIETFKFPNGAVGLRDVVITEGPGKLIGIMGASGAGKTTLLNVLAGIEKPSSGSIEINGIDINADKKKVHGVIGYVSQDDLLIEELTVYQNLFYNASLCFASLTEQELDSRVMATLVNLGLDQRKDLKVGTALDKTISGGQRKRLNIALELIREPAVLFLDEPTSGLSSRDSENVIDLLKELSLKGKLIFVVIHQPSSDIYKMFDKMILMDTGGYPVYNGRPVEAVTYFKKATHQAASARGQCEMCGNVNPEQIFNIIEAKVVDEYGQPTQKRKVTPIQWNAMYAQQFPALKQEAVQDEPPKSLNIPGRFRQAVLFTRRDLLSKVSNRQYLLINLLEAPLLAFILSFIIRYRSAPGGAGYSFRFNDNIPAYLLMGIIVALFMGLTISAEEIIRDRKILKRESFLNLSWTSYLISKIVILFSVSALQTFLFVIVGNSILEIHGMTFYFWVVLFSTSCMANVLGLNISGAFNSAVTVYVLIPLLLIPQMILSGLLFSFDKLNSNISAKAKVPVLADVMASRWAYEAIATVMFTQNDYQAPFYEYEKAKSQADFKSAYLADNLKERNLMVLDALPIRKDSNHTQAAINISVIRNTLQREPMAFLPEYHLVRELIATGKYTEPTGKALEQFLEAYQKNYRDVYNYNVSVMEKKMNYYESNGWSINTLKDRYFNESLSDLVKNINAKERLTEYDDKLLQLSDPIFQDPAPHSPLDYRTAFFVPQKNLAGFTVTTFWFNLGVLWAMSLLLYVSLYFRILRRFVLFFETISRHIPKNSFIRKRNRRA